MPPVIALAPKATPWTSRRGRAVAQPREARSPLARRRVTIYDRSPGRGRDLDVGPDVRLDRHVVRHRLHAGDVSRRVDGPRGDLVRIDEPGELHSAAEGLDVDLGRGHPALVDKRRADAVRDQRIVERFAGALLGAGARAGGER